MAAPSLRRLLLVAAVLSPAAGAAVRETTTRGSDLGAATSCDARQRGAKGDGKADDAKHLQAALDDPRCDTVVLTANHTFLSSALHVQRSGVTLTIEGGAMLAGKDGAIKQAVRGRGRLAGLVFLPDCGRGARLRPQWQRHTRGRWQAR